MTSLVCASAFVTCVADLPPSTSSEVDAAVVQDSEANAEASVDGAASADGASFCGQYPVSVFCSDFDDLDAGTLAGFQTEVQVQGGSVLLSTVHPKSPSRALRTEGVSVSPDLSSLGQLAAILPTNGVPHLHIELDAYLEGSVGPHQSVQFLELYTTDPNNPFVSLGENGIDGWYVSLTGGQQPEFVNIATPSSVGDWFHVSLDLTFGAGDAGSVMVSVGNRTAQKAGVQTVTEAGVLGSVNMSVGVDSYGDPSVDAASPAFVVHVDNVVVTQ